MATLWGSRPRVAPPPRPCPETLAASKGWCHPDVMTRTTWWQDFVDGADLDQIDAPASRTRAKRIRGSFKRVDKPRAFDDQTRVFRSMLAESFGSEDGHVDSDLLTRRRAAYELAKMADRVIASRRKSGDKRTASQVAQRVAAGASVAAAAGSGGALAAGVAGSTRAVLGITVVIIATLAGVGAAMLPESEYLRNREKARRYEQLYWDLWTYATLQLPTAGLDQVAARLEAFSAAIKDVGLS